MHTYYIYIEIHILLQHFDQSYFEGDIAFFYFEYFIKKVVCTIPHSFLLMGITRYISQKITEYGVRHMLNLITFNYKGP